MVSYPSDKLFFESFESSVQPLGTLWRSLLELKNRAIKEENVSYIETEFSTIPSKNTADLFGFNSQLRQLANNRNEKS
jgi:adenosine deaminase/adenosine deaminase CECR1